jgi:glycosyltransferase involved in cell wall biosynthesis
MKYKKIAFVGPLPPPLGGVAIMNQSFQNINYDGFEVISFDTSAKNYREDLYAKFKLKSIQRNLKISKKLNRFIEDNKPDVINIFITSGTSILRDILFLKKMSKFKIPVIIHFHSKTQGEFSLTPKRLKLVGRYFNRYARRIILLSDQHYNFFIYYFGKEKCVVIENFVNYKDYETFIRVAEELTKIRKDVTFVSVGNIHPDFQSMVSPYIENRHNTIRFIGFSSKPELIIKESDIGILCSDKEGISNSIMEYMAAGLPVITTDLKGASKELVREAETGFICSKEQLTEKLNLLLNSESLRKHLGEKGSQRIRSKFSLDKMVVEYIELYKKLRKQDLSITKKEKMDLRDFIP